MRSFFATALFHLGIALLTPPATAAAQQTAVAAVPAAHSHHVVRTVAAGQAGYVHYFLLTHPNGDLEHQVGIEMDDQRIAWSFPGIGASVEAFIADGALTVSDSVYQVRHLYGMRPFAEPARMAELRSELTPRVARWIDDVTPYCVMREPGKPYCLNCGDFVVRILFPGATPLVPALPPALMATAGDKDPLPFYMAGLQGLVDKPAMLARITEMTVPDALREDLLALINDDQAGHGAAATAVAGAPATPAAAAKPTGASPLQGRRVALRRPQARRL